MWGYWRSGKGMERPHVHKGGKGIQKRGPVGVSCLVERTFGCHVGQAPVR